MDDVYYNITCYGKAGGNLCHPIDGTDSQAALKDVCLDKIRNLLAPEYGNVLERFQQRRLTSSRFVGIAEFSETRWQMNSPNLEYVCREYLLGTQILFGY